MKVTFDKNVCPDLISTMKEILDFIEGRTDSVDLVAIQSAASELKLIDRKCEEVEVAA